MFIARKDSMARLETMPKQLTGISVITVTATRKSSTFQWELTLNASVPALEMANVGSPTNQNLHSVTGSGKVWTLTYNNASNTPATLAPGDVVLVGLSAFQITVTIPVAGDTSSGPRIEAALQQFLNNDASLKALIDSLRVTTGSGLTGGDGGLGIGQIELRLADAGVATRHIADAAVTTEKIQNNAITTPKIADDAVITAKIQDAAVTMAKIADNAVITAKIADNAITTPKIADNAITTAKIPDNAITTRKIQNAAITTAKIQDAAITAPKLNAGILTPAMLDATNTGAQGNIVTVGTGGSQFTFTDKIAKSSVGALLATSSSIVTGTVRAWTLNAARPAGIITNTFTDSTWLNSAQGLRCAKFLTDTQIFGLWFVLRNNQGIVVDRVLVPWRQTLAPPDFTVAPVARNRPDAMPNGFYLTDLGVVSNRVRRLPIIAMTGTQSWNIGCYLSGTWQTYAVASDVTVGIYLASN